MDLFLILLLCFMLRLLQTLRQAGDNSVHLWKIRAVGRRFGRLCAVDDSLFPAYQGYPGLPHYLMGFLPERGRVVGAYLANIAFDLVNVVLAWAAAVWLVRAGVLPSAPPTWPISLPAAAALVYGTMPILMPQTGRMVAFGGRALGALLLTVYFVSYGAAAYYGLTWLYAFSVACGVLILLASQFGMQALVVTSVGVALLEFDVRPALLLAVTFAVGCLTPGLPVARLLRAKINHFIWYARNKHTFAVVDNRNRLGELIRLPGYLWRRPRRFWRQVFRDNTFIIALYSVPALVVMLYWLARAPGTVVAIRNEPVLALLAAIVIASGVTFLLVSLRPLAFLGQAERYFEYSAPAIAILFVEYLARHDRPFVVVLWLVMLHVSGVVAIFIYCCRHLLFNAAREDEDAPFDELVAFLESRGPARIVTVPPRMSFHVRASLDNPEARFYYQFVVGDRLDGFKYMEESEASYNRLGDDLDGLVERLDVDTLVVSRDGRAVAERHGIDYRLAERRLLFENDEYAVYSLE